jgi:putative glycosyltransferase
MNLSIVTTLYRSAEYVKEFYLRASAAAVQLVGDDFEIVFVNDGSPDNSFDIVVDIVERDPRVVLVDLSRNFGHHKAMITGLAHSRGEKVFLIDCDLEEDPNWLLDFERKMISEKCDVVYGRQLTRRGGLGERVGGYLFYKLFRVLTGIIQPDNIVTARLMTRRYVDALLRFRETEINIGGLWIITGYHQCAHFVQKCTSSNTSYTLAAKVGHIVNAVTSFSSVPLMATFYVGLLTSAGAVAYIVFLCIKFYLGLTPPSGYMSLIASVWLFFGLTIFFMGIQGIYLSRIFIEVKQRPITIVRSVVRHEFK